MFKKIFFISISAGIFSSVACIVYNRIYFFAMETSFARLVNPGSILGINLAVTLVAGAGYFFARKWFKKKSDMVFNMAFGLISFGTILIPFAISLPLTIEHPELFPGLAVPMHFFPFVGWMIVKPYFIKD